MVQTSSLLHIDYKSPYLRTRMDIDDIQPDELISVEQATLEGFPNGA